MKLRSDLIATFKYHHKEKLQDIKDLFYPSEEKHKKNPCLKPNTRKNSNET